jgi:hypothetical protein
VKRPFSGSNCIAHRGVGQSIGVRLIGNELCNCVSNGLQITQNATACYPKIIEIAYNDIYITAELLYNG